MIQKIIIAKLNAFNVKAGFIKNIKLDVLLESKNISTTIVEQKWADELTEIKKNKKTFYKIEMYEKVAQWRNEELQLIYNLLSKYTPNDFEVVELLKEEFTIVYLTAPLGILYLLGVGDKIVTTKNTREKWQQN